VVLGAHGRGSVAGGRATHHNVPPFPPLFLTTERAEVFEQRGGPPLVQVEQDFQNFSAIRVLMLNRWGGILS